MSDVSLTQSTAPFSTCAYDDDQVDSGPHDGRASFDALTSNARDALMCLARKRFNGEHSPT